VETAAARVQRWTQRTLAVLAALVALVLWPTLFADLKDAAGGALPTSAEVAASWRVVSGFCQNYTT
jgi:hypothetical protein